MLILANLIRIISLCESHRRQQVKKKKKTYLLECGTRRKWDNRKRKSGPILAKLLFLPGKGEKKIIRRSKRRKRSSEEAKIIQRSPAYTN